MVSIFLFSKAENFSQTVQYFFVHLHSLTLFKLTVGDVFIETRSNFDFASD